MLGFSGKGSGMEIMIGTILQSMGINKESITDSIAKFEKLVTEIRNAMVETSERTSRIEQKIDLLLQNPVLNNVQQVSHEDELEEMELVNHV